MIISVSLKPNRGLSDLTAPLRSLGFDVYSSEAIVALYKDKCDIQRDLPSDRRYIIAQVTAPDSIAAAWVGIRNISEKMDIASFHNIIYPWEIRTVSIIVVNTASWYKCNLNGNEIYQTHDYIDSSSELFESTKSVLGTENSLSVKNGLKGAFSYANISRAAFFQEEKYLNMWVALEALSQTDMYGNIIQNIKEFVSSALCNRYFYRLIRNFYEDCTRCGIEFTFSSRSYNFANDSTRDIVKSLLAILRDHTLSSELLAKCAVNDLLYYRCSEVAEIANTAAVLNGKIVRHNRRIRWQLQRLYRVRNEIAHSALHQTSSLVIYIEHLYDYLACFIAEIVVCASENSDLEIDEIFSIIQDNYSIYLTNWNNMSLASMASFYSSGIMSFIL